LNQTQLEVLEIIPIESQPFDGDAVKFRLGRGVKAMKKIVGIAVMAALSLAVWVSPRRDDFPVLTGPYLGQTPPGNTPVIFAPGIVSTGLYTRDIAISKPGDEIFFCVADGGFTAIFATRP
jgi:hypothetical protein